MPDTITNTVPVEGRIVCGAEAAECRCVKDPGHADLGDPAHGCNPDVCTGQWIGDIDGDDFDIVRYPVKAVR